MIIAMATSMTMTLRVLITLIIRNGIPIMRTCMHFVWLCGSENAPASISSVNSALWESLSFWTFVILYFPIPRNALCLLPKFCINFECSWEYADLPRVFHNNSLCKIWGANRVHYGQLENSE